MSQATYKTSEIKHEYTKRLLSSVGAKHNGNRNIMNTTDNTIQFKNLNNMSINYGLVMITDITDLTGRTILVDDSSPEIAWAGSWETSNDPFLVREALNQTNMEQWYFGYSLPLGNGTHISKAVGDSFSFSFAGG